MIGYVTLGTNNLLESAKFYDALLAEIGAKRALEMDKLIAWANQPNTPMFSLIQPYDGKEATVGNGTMVSLYMESTDLVDRLHAKALELGATDEGQPRLRGGQFYGAYFRDLEGHKLCVFNYTSS